MESGPIASWQIEGEKVEAVTDFISNITVDTDCSHAMECYSAIKKKKWNFAICNNMDGLERYMLNEISQRKTNTVWYHLHVESKK